MTTSDRVCTKCGEIKAIELFVRHKQCREGRAHYCRTCDAKKTNNSRRDMKIRAIGYKGGRCSRCGGVFHPAVYDFHHVTPLEKDANPGELMGRNWDKVQAELDKCVLLCANCHRLTHTEGEFE